VVQEKASADDETIKTPFAKIRVRSADCTKKQREVIQVNDVNSLSHTSWNCKYHIVFAPNFRRKVFYGEKRREIGEILRTLCNWKDIKIIEAEVCPDHVHMLVEIPPKVAISSFMGYLKGKSSLMVYEKFPDLKYKYRNREFRCRGYYVDTAGKNAKKIQEYIKRQLEEDQAGEQLTMMK
jgi:Transposase and inactivated derivatives